MDAREMSMASARVPCAASPLFLYPLDEFYGRAQRELPVIDSIPDVDVPEPYRRLLVHRVGMTPTLEAAHRDRIRLHVLSHETIGRSYFREVVLLTERARTPVEYSVIKIDLVLFPPVARQRIIDGKTPLGAILGELSIPHASQPDAFLRIQSDSFIERALSLSAGHVLYGRRNTLSDSQQRALADVVEIVPPLPPGHDKD
jgi:hypothetical protein